MKKRIALICLLCAFLFCFSVVAVAGAENGIAGFSILDEVSFSTPKDSVEEIMNEHGFEKVEQYDAMVTVANTLVFFKGDPVFGNTVNTVWYEYTDNTYTTISQMLVRYAASADVCSQVISYLDNMYGNHIVDEVSGQGNVYVWYHDDVKLYIRGALFGDTLEDAEKGEAQSQIVITHLDEPVAETNDSSGSSEEPSDKAEDVLATDNQNAANSINLSNMSFDELVALKDQINLAIWNSQEWQEVTVPHGVWKVGEDIPAGTWTVRCADTSQSQMMLAECKLEWGEGLKDNGKSVLFSGRWDKVSIYNPNNKYYKEGQLTEYILTVQEGDYVIINDAYNVAVFTPYSGKPSLGFK